MSKEITNTQIRPYQPQDLPGLLTAWESASRLAHPFLPERFFESERINIPQLYIPNADTWVAAQGSKIIGFIALIVNEQDKAIHCEIGGLFVDPRFHRQGVGKSLVDKAKSIFKDMSVKVFQRNSIGRKFYDCYGFQTIGEVVWEDTQDILLELSLVRH